MLREPTGRRRRRFARITAAWRMGHGGNRTHPLAHRCRLERLEGRRLLSIDTAGLGDLPGAETLEGPSVTASALFSSITPLASTPIGGTTAEKPQSKVWSYDDTWWAVFGRDGDTWLSRLDSLAWTPLLELASGTYLADVKVVGNLAHVLLEKDSRTKLASVEYVSGSPGTYQFWSDRPALAGVDLSSSAETATIDVDSTGRLWVGSDAGTAVEVRYSDYPYSTWSNPITVASGIDSDDISVLTALPDDSIGVLWSNQRTERFGFRVHKDGANAANWSADEVPASQSALNVGGGMADDHLNVAVAADGTLYAAVKTSFDSSGFTKIGLLVRRPSGNWDPMYEVDTKGTRPIVTLSEAQGSLIVAYRNADSSGPIVYRESALDSIAFGPKETLISGSALNNPSSTKQSFVDELVVIAAGGGTAEGVLLSAAAVENQPPFVVQSFQDGVDGYGGTDDTRIRSDFADRVFGSSSKMEVDGNPDFSSLFKWDLNSIPTGATVLSATMSVNVVNASNDVFELYELKRPWDESAATFNQAAAGASWQVPGASGAGDRGSTVLGTITAPKTGLATAELNDAGIAAVQSWIANPQSNYGLIIQDYSNGTTDDLDFNSSETSNTADRPRLTLTYSLTSSGNQAPTVDAGASQTIFDSQFATLDATVTDDGLPLPPDVTTAWSVQDGPAGGVVTFGDPSAIDTTADFSLIGDYVLRLTADDGELEAFGELIVTVEETPTSVTQSFQDGVDGYQGTQDTRIRADFPDRVFGSSKKLEVDGNPDFSSLLMWDVSAIPTGATVVSASIAIDVIRSSNDFFEFYEMKRSWEESEATFNEAAAGTPWDVPGAAGAGDHGSTVLGAITAPQTGWAAAELNSFGLAVIQSWISDPAANFGLILQDYTDATTDDLDFWSSESGRGPILSVTYGLASA